MLALTRLLKPIRPGIRLFADPRISQKQLDERLQQLFKEEDDEPNRFDFGDYEEVMDMMDTAPQLMDKTDEQLAIEEFSEEYRKEVLKFNNFFANQRPQDDPHGEFMIEKSQQFIQSARLDHPIDYSRSEQEKGLLADYCNYSKFYRNFNTFIERKPSLNDDGTFDLNKRVFQYASALDPDGLIANRDTKGAASVEQRGAKPADKQTERLQQQFKFDPDYPLENVQDLEELEEEFEDAMSVRLSMESKHEIYNCYKEGWTVHDLSMRFGILPERVKAIVYFLQYFFDDVLPYMTKNALKHAIDREKFMEMQGAVADYGIDLHLMIARDRAMPNAVATKYKFDINDVQPWVKYLIESELKKYPLPNQQYITRTTVGKGPKAYKVVDMIVNKGSGVVDVSPMFKYICKNESNPHLFPKKVRKNLSRGPRAASAGYHVSKPRARNPAFKVHVPQQVQLR